MNQKNLLGLNNCFLDKNHPIDLFEAWMNEAKKTEPNDPNAVALGTSDHNNSPSIRMVLLKDFSNESTLQLLDYFLNHFLFDYLSLYKKQTHLY